MAEIQHPIVFPLEVRDRLLATIYERLPRKSFGYLISHGDPRRIDDFILFEGNTRNSTEWKPRFEAYGQYFLEHDDAGFVSSPEETWHVQKEMWRRGMTEVGIFHSHLRHPANFSGIDYDMHISRYSHLWHMIIAVRNRTIPQIRIFDVTENCVREQEISGAADPAETMDNSVPLEELFGLDADGRPLLRLAKQILKGMAELTAVDYDRFITHGMLAGSQTRYYQYIEPLMRAIPSGHFLMGTEDARRRHFIGECPAYPVQVPAFTMSTVPVTNDLMGLLDPARLDVPADLHKPAVSVTWHEAKLFAFWMGCRLPAENEWEYACGAGSEEEWACALDRLPSLAWYSENTHGVLQEVGKLEHNNFHLHDMHGNVWEWCEDRYGQDTYDGALPTGADRVCRGGSIHALPEMCRTRYRLHEPANFFADDLGFRLARGM